MPGEDAHVIGAAAVQRAKRWLEGTMRVSQAYTNTHGSWGKKLSLNWPHGGRQPFSFDLGGVMRGGEWDSEMFCAEVKWRKSASDQGPEFRSFLAKCYVSQLANFMLGDHYMWISWAPFRANSWDRLTTPAEIRDAVLMERERALGTADLVEAEALLKEDVIAEVAARLWLVVLSEKQERLVPLDDWRGVVAQYYSKGGSSW